MMAREQDKKRNSVLHSGKNLRISSSVSLPLSFFDVTLEWNSLMMMTENILSAVKNIRPLFSLSILFLSRREKLRKWNEKSVSKLLPGDTKRRGCSVREKRCKST
jgi:hypothetical protein